MVTSLIRANYGRRWRDSLPRMQAATRPVQVFSGKRRPRSVAPPEPLTTRYDHACPACGYMHPDMGR